MFSTTIVKLVVLGAAGTQAAAGVIEARTGFNYLFTRQPLDCTSLCTPIQNALETCADMSCLCASAVAVSLNDCVNCYYLQSPTPDILATANELINQYASTCSAYDLPPASVTTIGVESSTTTTESSTITSPTSVSTTSSTSMSTSTSSTSMSTATSFTGGAVTFAPPNSPYPPLTLPRPPFAIATTSVGGPTNAVVGGGTGSFPPAPVGGNGALSNRSPKGWCAFVTAASAMLAVLVL